MLQSLAMGIIMIERLLAMLTTELDDQNMIEQVNPSEWCAHFDEGISISLRKTNTDTLIFQTIVTDLLHPTKRILIDLLSANCFGFGALGNVLCIDEMGKVLMLIQEKHASMAYRDFVEILKDLVCAANFWKKRLTVSQ